MERERGKRWHIKAEGRHEKGKEEEGRCRIYMTEESEKWLRKGKSEY